MDLNLVLKYVCERFITMLNIVSLIFFNCGVFELFFIISTVYSFDERQVYSIIFLL